MLIRLARGRGSVQSFLQSGRSPLRDRALEALELNDLAAHELLLSMRHDLLHDSWALHDYHGEAAWTELGRRRLCTTPARFLLWARHDAFDHNAVFRVVLGQDLLGVEAQLVDPPCQENALWILTAQLVEVAPKCVCRANSF